MARGPEGSRVYIVYQHSLFAEGLRSLLQDQPAVRIIGAETDQTKVLKEIKALKPSVVLIEESATDPQQAATWDLLHRQGAGRVVALNLDHSAATVYDRASVSIATPVDLLHAVRGTASPSAPEAAPVRSDTKPKPRTVPKAKSVMRRGKTGRA